MNSLFIIVVLKVSILDNAKIQVQHYTDTPATAILNSWLREMEFRLSVTACLTLIINSLLKNIDSFIQMNKEEKKEPHQSAFDYIKFDEGIVWSRQHYYLFCLLSLHLFVARTSHLFVTSQYAQSHSS